MLRKLTMLSLLVCITWGHIGAAARSMVPAHHIVAMVRRGAIEEAHKILAAITNGKQDEIIVPIGELDNPATWSYDALNAVVKDQFMDEDLRRQFFERFDYATFQKIMAQNALQSCKGGALLANAIFLDRPDSFILALLAAGAIPFRGNKKFSPIGLAAFHGRVRIVARFLDYPEAVLLQDVHPFVLACRGAGVVKLPIGPYIKILEMLIERNCLPSDPYDSAALLAECIGWTPIGHADKERLSKMLREKR